MTAGARTRGHPAASAAIAAMVRGRASQSILLVGPAGVGKTTLARDLSAGLLCERPTEERPCGACRPCRLVEADHHPDIHRLRPDGPGRQVGIGGPGKTRGVRELVADLALLPVEGGARIGIIESADRMNDDAQAALLKTLEEPGGGVVLILCADTDTTILPTIQSRCARIRLGPVGVRDIEAILVEAGAADAPTAARLARVADGRPGLALAWAADRDALIARDELGRSLLDLLDVGPAARLAGVRAAAGRATLLAAVGDRVVVDAPSGGRASGGRATGSRGARAAATAVEPVDDTTIDGGAPAADPVAVRAPASERRRAAEALVARWTDLARDIALCQLGATAGVRDLGLLDETSAVASRVRPAEVTAFLDRLGIAGVRLRGNVSPDLVLDDLAVHWSSRAAAAR